MDIKPVFREGGDGIEYTTKSGVKYIIYNDPDGMLIKVRIERSDGVKAGSMPVSLGSNFTTFERAQTEVERYLFEHQKPQVKKKRTPAKGK
ncbi:MAG TPA: hypothetical protein EYP39_04970 [Ghiorsea sp.]|nr:hypothetical protein [Ghiorsea sp.]